MTYCLEKLERIIKYINSKKMTVEPKYLAETYNIDLDTAEYLLVDGKYHNTKWLFMLHKFLETNPSIDDVLDCFDERHGMLDLIEYVSRDSNVNDSNDIDSVDNESECISDRTAEDVNGNDEDDEIDTDLEKYTYKYRQKECYDKFLEILKTPSYWGMLVAPTGWGKSFMHLLLIGAYFKVHNDGTNVVIVTKRKDLVEDQHLDMDTKIKRLKVSDMFPKTKIKIESYVKHVDYKLLNKNANYRKIIVINSDKIIKDKTTKIDWSKIGFVIFDEMHWIGSNEIYKAMKAIKDVGVKFCIGSSATPMRKHYENQQNIKLLMESNVLMEISYIDAWANKVIVPVHTVMMKVSDYEEVDAIDESIDGEDENYEDVFDNVDMDQKDEQKEKTKKKKMIKFTNVGKRQILVTLSNYLKKVQNKKAILFFASRTSLLEWYSYIMKKNYFATYHKYVSFSVTKGKNDNKILRAMKELDIDISEAECGLKLFKQQKKRALVFVVFRGTEGFDDPKVSICVEMDFRYERSIVLMLQKMGRAQRLCDGKDVGYYLRFVPSDSDDDVKKEIVSACINYLKYIGVRSNDLINLNTRKGMNLQIDNDTVSDQCVMEIIKMFNIDESIEFTHDDMLKEIKTAELNEKGLDLRSFVNILRTHKITNHSLYHKFIDSKKGKALELPYDYESIEGFSWDHVVPRDTYYTKDEIIPRLREITKRYHKKLENLDDNDEILQVVVTCDKKVPNNLPWKHYDLKKSQFSFLFNT
ncbi:DEXDc helicase [Yasminevirus sp. GU-2018]|uniref:DEXDc helicase n=1 Tax=Yasminevirus sp. GU-2018 TaxID=2420051 RepID=A0A5K0U6V9_9VIRU|nr:DEXDc helicase [Yasminevirus sp. GU-2018]